MTLYLEEKQQTGVKFTTPFWAMTSETPTLIVRLQ